jgi:DNA-binding SARP family transcriptional activator
MAAGSQAAANRYQFWIKTPFREKNMSGTDAKHRIILLGPTRVELEGAEAAASLYRPRKVAVLAYLLMAGRPVRRLELASLLWPDVAEKRARGSLNQLLVEMRRELGADAFTTRSDDELTLSPAFQCDARELECAAARGDLQAVLDLYSGRFLDGFVATDLDMFSDWAARTRAMIDDRVADAASRLAAAHDVERDEAASMLRIAAGLRPYDEAILRRRMLLAFEASGAAQAAALYEAHRARVAQEIGIAPSQETRKLLLELCDRHGAASDSVVNATAITPHKPRARGWTPRFGSRIGKAAVFAFLLAGTLFVSSEHQSVDVALMSFGDQSQPAIRALPGLVATYLIRDTSIKVVAGSPRQEGFQVQANLRSEGDDVFGTVQIRDDGRVVASTVLRTSMRLGIDTIAAELARYVSDVTSPVEYYASPSSAVRAARRHLLYAKADFARGVHRNAAFELEKATMQLDSVTDAARDADWDAAAADVAREREWQRRGE